jgi:imidazolonepropionase-like amidohydrolase
MQFVIALACRYMRLLPSEALVGATLNAAHAIELGRRVGSLEPGKLADMVKLDATDYRMLGYRFGTTWPEESSSGASWSPVKMADHPNGYLHQHFI